ncbi:hypothetical protein [Novosphingobium soli]|uniref:Lipoprotein n=1 Tax=Novosphingobium soli TaxID=574956 RepID=A0ABV6CZY0_9SPHN
MRQTAALAAVLLLPLAACSSEKADPDAARSATRVAEDRAQAVVTAEATRAASASSAAPSSPATATVLGLEGLGPLRVGQPLPGGGRWAARGAQASDTCTEVSSPDYPGVYAIVVDGKVRRITLGARSSVKLAEGIGVGDSEAEVKAWFAGFREEGHKYHDPPAKYLTAPNARPGESALRFEIDADRRVGLIHVGEMPVLAYVEGCL